MENHNDYDTFDNETQEFITLRCLNSEKYANEKLKVKSSLLARGFQEDTSNVSSESPT